MSGEEKDKEVEVLQIGSSPTKVKVEKDNMTVSDALFAAGVGKGVDKIKIDGKDASMDSPIKGAKRITAVPKVRGGA